MSTVIQAPEALARTVGSDASLSDVELVLDLSRLVSRMRHATPTGVDRVELAYARGLQQRLADRLAFAVVHPSGLYGRITTDRAKRFLARVERTWEAGAEGQAAPGWIDLVGTLALARPASVPAPRRPRVFLQSSPHHLHRANLMRSILQREQARFVCLLHDLIPIEYPEYARPGGNGRHLARMRTVAALADGVIANSQATARSFAPYLDQADRSTVPIAVAHLGWAPIAPMRATPMADPYFVCIGTIEPRKNHLLLLHLWRQLAEERALHPTAPPLPRLVLIGRRGWENEQVIDMLERCPALRGVVEERAGLPDTAVRALLAGSRGLLMPSFAEGFGLPVPEALALGVPVLCSDLPALREAGGGAPDYLDPLDGPGWRRAILSLANPADPARAGHLARIAQWRAPSWGDHLAIVLGLVSQVAARVR